MLGVKDIVILYFYDFADLTNILRGLIIQYQTKWTLTDKIDTIYNSNTKSVVDSGLRTM